MPVSYFSAKAGFKSSVGMMEIRLALPQRSPMPFSVPWIWRTPASTAASELATAWPVSSCAWMPNLSPRMPEVITASTILRSSDGCVPPLVSQSTTQRAPAS